MVQLLLTLALLAAPASPPQSGAEEALPARRWTELAERWILLPPEERKLRNLRTYEEQEKFLDDAWRRRDPDPTDGENPARERFEARVEEANELFPGEGRLGALTDRGRVYVLVGPPSRISQKYHPTPRFSPLMVAGDTHQPSKALVETWSWRPEDLAPEIRKLLKARHWKTELVVEFRVSTTRYSLLEGEELVKLSTRALVRSAER